MTDDLATFGSVMRTLKRSGLDDFSIAWRCAYPPSRPSYKRAASRAALDETRSSWARAWHQEPPTSIETAAARLALMLDEGARVGCDVGEAGACIA